jgi:long-subunit acyl-CoA synthetase (AMP-forming)
LDKVKERIGLNQHKVIHVGAAPIHRTVLEYFMKFNLPILELYGMSECTGPATLNSIDNWRLGSVGKAICGTKVKLDNIDENGEGEVSIYTSPAPGYKVHKWNQG